MSVSIPPVAGIENLEPEQIKTFKDFLVSYNKLSEMCFNDCVDNFTSRNVRDKEVWYMYSRNSREKCALHCLEKFLKVNQRISERVHEFQMLANENAMAAAQKMKS